MQPFRSFHAATRVAFGLAFLLACPVPVRAQSFVEFGGGWNYHAPAPVGEGYGRGYNVRASFGQGLAPRVRVRFDAFVSLFADSTQFYPPCPFPGCTKPYYNVNSAYVSGLSANWQVDADPRGILYAIGGAGVYDVDTNGKRNELAIGVSAGAGISAPIRAGLRAFVEARYHIPFGATAELPWIVPVTFGVRF